jgi:hypothetical protein
MCLRIGILRSDDAHHVYLDYLLSKRFDMVCRVIEPAASQRRALLSRGKYRDYAYSLYHTYRRRLFGLDAYRRRFFSLPRHALATITAPQLVVRSINETQVQDALKAAKPDITIVICTSILKSGVIAAASNPIVNVHGGYLPYYRGNHCFFFAVWNQDFAHVGSTLHFVNKGIDTGDIIEVVIPNIYRTDTPETLYCRADQAAIHRLIHWLCYFEQGGILPRFRQPHRHRLYRTCDRGPVLDFAMWLRRTTKQIVLPESRTGGPVSPISTNSDY